jgi:hypothetical protein
MDFAPDARLVEDQQLEWNPDIRLESIRSLYVDLGAVPERATGA